MSMQMDGQFANERFTQENEEVTHGFAGIVTVEKNIVTAGYAEMDIERTEFMCECGEGFACREDLDIHILDYCPHTDEVRWNPSRGCFTCVRCSEEIDIPELMKPHPDQDISIKL